MSAGSNDKKSKSYKKFTVALAGNPNVGKSTLFNSLTGMRVHTGNWAGKTVGLESSRVRGEEIDVVDIPGTYSLYSHSEEERIARDHIIFGGAEVTVVVCDACALRQNLNLVLQVIESGARVVVAVNLMDEAKRRGIKVDTEVLSHELGVRVVGTVAHKRKSLDSLVDMLKSVAGAPPCEEYCPQVRYPELIEAVVSDVAGALAPFVESKGRRRFIALRLIDSDEELKDELLGSLGPGRAEACEIERVISDARGRLFSVGIGEDEYRDYIASSLIGRADEIYSLAVSTSDDEIGGLTRRFDKILTGRVCAYPIMLILLALIFFITLSLANYPSAWLSSLFSWAAAWLRSFFDQIGFSEWLIGLIVDGVFGTLAKVVAVMLPPMAIFFPLFSLLEDSGYLPRIAYNLDRPFSCCGACGKQALTMCMGFGCNAVGIVGCRIIDSKRERRLAIVTNSLVPCNGRLPMLLSIICVFCLFFGGAPSSIASSLLLSLLIVLSVFVTFVATAFLSRTLMRGERSSFTIELPPYRKPRILSTLYHSLTEKCASVLLRAITVAAPMGLVIWLLANILVEGQSVLSLLSTALDPVGRFFGMDGAILLAFILGIPANEIVIPILLLIYTETGSLGAEAVGTELTALLIRNGWTPITAACTALFALFHWPCSTSIITIYKETKSPTDTLIAVALPTLVGLILCFIVSTVGNLII